MITANTRLMSRFGIVVVVVVVVTAMLDNSQVRSTVNNTTVACSTDQVT